MASDLGLITPVDSLPSRELPSKKISLKRRIRQGFSWAMKGKIIPMKLEAK